MTIIRLENASLESPNLLGEVRQSSSSSSSFNLLDTIRRSSHKPDAHGKRVPVDPSEHGSITTSKERMTFNTAITESLSTSSAELTGALKTFSLFQASSPYVESMESRNDDEFHQETYYSSGEEARNGKDDEDDDEDREDFGWTEKALPRGFRLPPYSADEDDTEFTNADLMSPAERALKMLDDLSTSSSTSSSASASATEAPTLATDVTSPLHSLQSSSSDESDWEGGSTGHGTRAVSLLDATSAVETRDEDGDAATTCSDGKIPSINLRRTIQELGKEDLLDSVGALFQQIGGCNFREFREPSDVDYYDDYSVTSDYPQTPDSRMSRGPRSKPTRFSKQSYPPVALSATATATFDESIMSVGPDYRLHLDAGETPKHENVGFFRSLFSCGG